MSSSSWVLKSLLSQEREKHFLVLVSSLYENAFSNFKEKMNPQLLSDKKLQAIIMETLSQVLFRLILKTCVYEMHEAREKNKLTGNDSKQRFDHFIQLLAQPESYISLLKKYPALNGVIQKTYDQYFHNMLTVFSRLSKDMKQISNLYFNGEILTLKKIKAGGDPHCNGQSVMTLEFENGHTLIYKPRSLNIDLAFYTFLNWVNKKHDFQFYIPKIIAHENYGWYEFIEHLPCQNLNEVKLFYKRLGGLLSISQLLGSNDLHAENIIAYGSHPIFIDLECTLRPSLKKPLASYQNYLTRHFVIDTSLLPLQSSQKNASISADMTGLGKKHLHAPTVVKIKWINAGTDNMQLAKVKRKILPFKNIPFVRNHIIDPMAHENSLLEGFEKTYLLIFKKKTLLSSPKSPLIGFKSTLVRVVLRPTETYTKLLNESFHPLLFHNAEAYLKHIKWLEENNRQHLSDSILTSEMADILSNNIPYFYCHANQKKTYGSQSEPVELLMKSTPYKNMMNQLAQFWNPEDLALQKKLIQSSYSIAREKKNKKSSPSQFKTLSKGHLHKKSLGQAKKILDELIERAIVEKNYITWPSVKTQPDYSVALDFTNLDLYSGASGIGLTFLYASEIYRNEQYKNIAHQVLNILLEAIEKNTLTLSTIGAYSGLSGIVYTLSCFYYKLPSLKIQKALMKVLTKIETLIENDQQLDIIEGCAGFIAVLIYAKPLIEKNNFNRLLKKCVEHLLKLYPEPSVLTPFQKKNGYSQALLGFSHGVAGIAWALNHANVYLKRTDVSLWVQEALIYEDQYFNKIKNNWPNFIKKSPSYQTAWCHGAPGIGLSRLTMNLPDKMLSAEKNTLKNGFSGNMCVCHGSLGNLEFLHQLKNKIPSKKRKTNYLKAWSNTISQIEQNGLTLQVPSTLFLPGLMLGNAGIAYQLMRLVSPEKVPSILMMV
jgi:type 2 lantibiotic biosynthesis protein LanM